MIFLGIWKRIVFKIVTFENVSSPSDKSSNVINYCKYNRLTGFPGDCYMEYDAAGCFDCYDARFFLHGIFTQDYCTGYDAFWDFSWPSRSGMSF